MIKLFHIPKYVISTYPFDNLLHDKIVRQFEENFAEYVGARYAVSLHSATAAIFLSIGKYETIKIPSILPPVVANALITAGNEIEFEDNIKWIGSAYTLYEWSDCKLIDSAHQVERDQFANTAQDDDLMIFSFYPTKPLSGKDGGIIVSNNKKNIEEIRTLANNGMIEINTANMEKQNIDIKSFMSSINSWEKKQTQIGYKLYMDSISAWVAGHNLKKLDYKKEKLAAIREKYNEAFGLSNTSDHLYRIAINYPKTVLSIFMRQAKEAGIECGKHYYALHHNPIFNQINAILPLSNEDEKTMVSIPFHEELTDKEIGTVIKFVHEH